MAKRVFVNKLPHTQFLPHTVPPTTFPTDLVFRRPSVRETRGDESVSVRDIEDGPQEVVYRDESDRRVSIRAPADMVLHDSPGDGPDSTLEFTSPSK